MSRNVLLLEIRCRWAHLTIFPKNVVYDRVSDDGDDPNADSCIDPVLRDDINNALNKVTDRSCKGIVKTLLFNLNRPGWAVNCVDFDAMSLDGIVQDMNFCAYIGVVSPYIFDIRLGKIDMS
ncbi:hypothetical protein OESDEN_11775 [Oesophagostomum dentatum]|uniref:Uncharacterized protein n=1 Tax=Oesophagostomum dentatum TaxID=61180 RepID=A0A0B1SSZ3_OESDE|nr:hypothetical protein OESDEN_11775 [Oesophagostomum dentatum]